MLTPTEGGGAASDPVANDLMPEEDFSSAGIARRRWAEIDAATRNASAVAKAQQTPAAQLPRGAAYGLEMQRKNAAARLAALTQSRTATNLAQYPTLHKAVVGAIADGADITESDIARLINVKEAESAARMLLAANGVDETRQKNIIATASPEMRAAIFDLADSMIARERLKQIPMSEPQKAGFDAAASTAVGWLGTAIGAVGSNLASDASGLLNAMNAGWENAQHVWRAGTFVDDATLNNPITSIFIPARVVTNWGKTETGTFNEGYLQSLKDSGKYDPLAVDILADISRETAAGEAEPIIKVMSSPKYAGNANADTIFREVRRRAA